MQLNFDISFNIATQKRINDENQANHDRAKLNGSTGDHSALDNAIAQANGTYGLIVTRDADYQTTKNSDDYNGIAFWQSDTKGLYSREADAINAAIAQQRQNNKEYDDDINQLASDHHAVGNGLWTNGGYVNLPVNWDITWHYNKDSDTVTVTNTKLTLTRNNPSLRGGGFWDTILFTVPGSVPPTDGRTYDSTPANPDLVKTGTDVWNRLGSFQNQVLAYFSQNNNNGQYAIKYNSPAPYTVHRGSDGKFTLMTYFNRFNKKVPGTRLYQEAWNGGNTEAQVTIPTRKTTSVSYHYNKLNVNSVPDKSTTVHYHYDVILIR